MMNRPQPLDERAAGLICQLASVVGVPRFRLFGGAAFDLLVNPDARCMDLDLAFRDDEEVRNRCLVRLANNADVKTIGSPREYWICYSVPVIIVSVRWRGYTLDINFLDDNSKIGHFNIERVYWDYPELVLGDPHGVTSGRSAGLRLVTSTESENPILLLNRLLKLSAKYNFRLMDIVSLVSELVQRASNWWPDDQFHGFEAHDAHQRALASSIARAFRPKQFLGDILDTGILDARLPLLADAVRTRPDSADVLVNAPSQREFWATADRLLGRGGPAWRRYRPRGTPSALSLRERGVPVKSKSQRTCDAAG